MRVLKRTLTVLVLMPAFLVLTAQAEGDFDIIDQPLPNGDFAAGLADWTVMVSPPAAVPVGSVSVINGSSSLNKGGAFITELRQSFVAPEGLQALRFSVVQLPQFQSNGGFIPEAFDVNVIGSNGFSRVATFRLGPSAVANATAVPSGFNLADGVSFDGSDLRIALDGVALGENLQFSVTLAGPSSATTSSVIIDDVVLEVLAKIIPDRVDGCGYFNDRFELSEGVNGIARCALGQINDTGIAACLGDSGSETCPIADAPGQDAEGGRDALAGAGLLNKLGRGPAGFDYTKLDVNGDALPDSATEWACVRDNYAGLIWEVKVDDPADPRHFEHSYSWYLTESGRNGGDVGLPNGGVCTGSDCDLEGLTDAINATRLCGATDWRVPTRLELQSLVNAGEESPAISSAYFPWTAGAFWSLTPVAADSASAWEVDFAQGDIQRQSKSTALRVRLVREVK
ncbi:MAG: DUF1566 domain-containing protein [Pseudomonadota bacterium]